MSGTWHNTSVEDLLQRWQWLFEVDNEGEHDFTLGLYFNASSIHPTHYENIQRISSRSS